MKKLLWIAAVVAILLIAIVLYRRSAADLGNVEPNAREQIEKARQR